MVAGPSGKYLQATASTSNQTTWFLRRKSDHETFTNDISIKLNHNWDDIEELCRILFNWASSNDHGPLELQSYGEGIFNGT